MNRQTLLFSGVFVALASGLLASDAIAIDPGACCAHTTSKLDALLNPVQGGDENFFTKPKGPPNVVLVLDNSGSMIQNWPIDIVNSTGGVTKNGTACAYNDSCDCQAITDTGYNKNTAYEPELENLSGNSYSARYYQDWFATGSFYNLQPEYGTGNKPSGSIFTNTTDACASTSIPGQCQQCLTDKGYYLDSTGWQKSRVAGNFLNHLSPRYTMLKNVVKQVIRDIQPVRLTVLAFNGSDGKSPYIEQPPTPSCTQAAGSTSNWWNNRNAVLGEIDKINYGGGTPLTLSLYGAGYVLQDQPTSPSNHLYRNLFGPNWNTIAQFNASSLQDTGGNQASICFTCTYNAIVLLTDGEPTINTDNAENSIPGPVGDTQLEVDDCPECATSDLDELALALHGADFRSNEDTQAGAGQQNVSIYTVAFGLDDGNWGQKLLRNTAAVGGGKFYSAKNSSQLKRALTEIFDDIQSKNTSFSAASVASLQTGTTVAAAILPRLRPQRDLPWQGSLYRFELYNEFVQETDKNGDGDQADTFVLDTGNDRVEENSLGEFVKAGTNTPAEPIWEASAKMRQAGHASRRIWTVRDDSGPDGAADGKFTQHDSPLEFTVDNWQILEPYLGIKPAGICPTVDLLGIVAQGPLLTALNTFTFDITDDVAVPLSEPPTQDQLDELCIKTVIRWVRGQDLGDEDGDGNRSETRRSILGDIFHSSPVLIDPPVDKFLCEFGIHNQCVRTLYSQTLGINATELETGLVSTDACGVERKMDAYDYFQHKYRGRDKVVVVGANDGMLHAFRDSVANVTCDTTGGIKTERVDYSAVGGGQEEWAFIPPDLLPRMFDRIISGHQYLLDADIMVREIWHDDNGNGTKEWSEYKTVAIAAEGRGGPHYLSVELKWDDSGRLVRTFAADPDSNVSSSNSFRWLFPQPCSDEAAKFGKTLYALNPKPPPIGPVLLESTNGNAVDRMGLKTEERWIAFLSGGWSPAYEKGRGVYMVDVYDGVANESRDDNLVWKFEFDPDATGERDGPKRYLTNSIVAPVSMADYGATAGPTFDGFYDTAVVGDTGGQLWTLRFHAPGARDASTGLVKNWGGARAFEMDRNEASSVKNVNPFYYPTSLGLQPDNNALRAFFGSGDRYSMLDQNAGTCRFDNPQVCARYGCGDVDTDQRVNRYQTDLTFENEWAGQTLIGPDEDRALSLRAMCGIAGVTPAAEASIRQDIQFCNGTNYPGVRNIDVACGQPTAGQFTCRRTDANVNNLGKLDFTVNSTVMAGLGRNRFYGVWVFGGHDERKFDPSITTVGADGVQTAEDYDEDRKSDRTSANTTSGDLVDVTATTCTATSCTGNQAKGTDWGWMFELRNAYPASGAFNQNLSLSHKTAGGASLIASCSLWNTLHPVVTATTDVCSSPIVPRGRFHQGDFITGAPNCAFALNNARFEERSIVAPPPEPATTIQVSKSGKLRYSTLILEPGSSQATEVSVSQGSDVLQSVYELPITPELHKCRHEGVGCTE